MKRVAAPGIFLLAVAILCGIGGLGLLCWQAVHSGNNNFLPARSPAKWIVYPAAPTTAQHVRTNVGIAFRRSFNLNSQPNQAKLTWMASRGAAITVNGAALMESNSDNWKQPVVTDIAHSLKSGSNTIVVSVTHDHAPPALWLHLKADQLEIVSDDKWETSVVSPIWRQARLASTSVYPQAGNVAAGGERPFDVLLMRAPYLFLFGCIAATLLAFGERINWVLILTRAGLAGGSSRLLAIAMTAVWFLLLFHNSRLLPPLTGFDVSSHIEYVQYVQKNHSLPDASTGFETYQPPLYYVVSATILEVLGQELPSQNAVTAYWACLSESQISGW
jgi:hypothetical protein